MAVFSLFSLVFNVGLSLVGLLALTILVFGWWEEWKFRDEMIEEIPVKKPGVVIFFRLSD